MASEYKVGDYATFKAYDEALSSEPGFVPNLEAGQLVRIETINDDGGMAVFAIDEDGNPILDGENKPVGDTLFPEEVEPFVDGEAEGSEEGVDGASATDEATAGEAAPAEAAAPAAPKRSAGKGKTAAAPKEKAPTKAELKAKEKAEKEAAKAKAIKDKEDAKAKAAADKEAAAKVKAEEKAKKEAERAAKLASSDNDDPLMIRVDETQSVKTIIASEKGALEAAKVLVNRSEQTDFTLGGVLHNIYVTGAFKTLGYDGKRGFSDYVERELGVQYRKARYLISIYTTFAQVFRAKGITEEDLLKIGWSKAKELARVPVDKLVADYDVLIAMAVSKEKSRDELIEHIKENYEVVQREEKVKAIDLKFRLVADAADVVNEALNKAKGLAGDGADLNKALEYMAGDWLNTAESQNTMTLQSLIDLAAAQFGVTLEVVEGPVETSGEAAEQAA